MQNENTIYKTANLGEIAYLLNKKFPLSDAFETADGNIIFLFEKTPQLDSILNNFYSGNDESFALLEILKKIKFIVHNKNLLQGFVSRYKIQQKDDHE